MINYFKKLNRISFVIFFILLMISTIIIRCINLQYIENKNYSNKIEKREIREQNIKASRGIISDRNKNILADSILLDTLEVNDPKLFLSKNSKEKIQELCKVINKKML